MAATLKSLDTALGDRLDLAVRRHHRRRLRRLGWEDALDAPPGDWAPGAAPPREGNRLAIHVDGAEALRELAAAIGSARSSVHLAGWHFAPDFRLCGTETLRELLAETAERVEVRLLAWAGAPLPLFRPDRRAVAADMARLAGGTRIRVGLDRRERPLHCHHEKLALIDERVAYVGGIDLTNLGGDRLDSSEHPARGADGWHDALARLEGPAVAGVREHFALRWRAVTGEPLAAPGPLAVAGETAVQVVRTVPEGIYPALARGEFSLLQAYLGALRGAQQSIYLESQFLWSPEIVAVLAAKLRRPPSDAFRLLVLLPAHPRNGTGDSRGQLAVLAEADDGAGRMLACTLYQSGTQPPGHVYVHAKIAIVDDRWLTLGSANLNDHSLFNDSELNVVCADQPLVHALRLRLWSEHLQCPAEELEGDPSQIIDELWRPRAEEGAERLRRGLPPGWRLAALPDRSRRARRLLGPLDGLLVDG